MDVVVRIKTEKPEIVRVYIEEVLRQIAKNEHFSVLEYEIELKEGR